MFCRRKSASRWIVQSAFPEQVTLLGWLRKERRGSVELIVAGVMSGTSADGVDVALVRLTGRRSRMHFELIEHCAFPYPAVVREAVLRAMNAPSIASIW